MKTQTANNRIVQTASAMLLALMFSFTFLAQAAPINSSFDHTKTGFVLKDVHATLKCEQCHVDAIFKNTPKDCAGCHTTGTRVGAKPKPINHVPTTDACDTCHTSAANFLVKSYSHVGITGKCSTCHNGQSLGVISKPANHFPTLLPCETCHTNTSTFLSFKMDHTGITGGCFSCHGGPPGEPGPIGTFPNTVSYNSTIHVPLTSFGATPPDCNVCHTSFTTFLGAKFDHLGVTAGSCGTCHKGQYPNVVSINAATHIGGIPAAACDTCHFNYSSFLGATFTHTLGSVCSTCHQGQYAGVVSINTTIHIPLPTGSTCSSGGCHADPTTQTTPTFLGLLFHAGALGNPPAATCSTCHNGNYESQNALTKGTNHIPVTADCGTCHTSTTTASYTTFLNVKFHQTSLGTSPTGTCTACHSGSFVSEGALGKNTGHVSTTSDCVACHTGPSGTNNTVNFTTFLGASFSHTPGAYAVFPAAAPASPRCDSCHNGTTAKGKVISHVTTTGDCNSSGCHVNSITLCPNCLSFYGVVYSHTNATTGVAPYGATFPAATATPAPPCLNCHNGSASTALGALGMIAGHVATPTPNNCNSCHTPASTGCPNCSTFLGATFSHTGVTAACSTCHQGQIPGTVSINTSIHVPLPASSTCDQCHTNTITGILTVVPPALPTFLNVKFHTTSYGNAATPPAGMTCTTCHNGSYTSQNASAKNSGHVSTTSDCVICHTQVNTSSYTTFLGAATNHTATYPSWISAGTTPTAPASPTCASCHNGVTATGTNAGHPSIGTTDCTSCHTSTVLSAGCPTACTSFGIAAGAAHTTASGSYTARCDSCHNGSKATGLSADASHILINSIDCGQCHPAYDGVGSINFSTAASAGAGMVGTITKYAMNHTGLTGRCDSCHNGTYIGQGLFGALNKVSNHIPTTIISTAANTDCTTCHTTLTMATIKVVSGAADWATEKMNHNNAQGGSPNYCVTCHLSGVTYLSKAQKKNHNGSSTTKDCSSSSCHKPLGKTGTAYSSWGG